MELGSAGTFYSVYLLDLHWAVIGVARVTALIEVSCVGALNEAALYTALIKVALIKVACVEDACVFLVSIRDSPSCMSVVCECATR